MNKPILTFIGGDCRMEAAQRTVAEAGISVSPWPSEICSHLVLPLPAFLGDSVRGGPTVAEVLEWIRPGMTVLGGMLGPHQQALEAAGATLLDYYEDEALVAANAEITAEAATALVMERLPVTLRNTRCLILGWGRIGQLLAKKLAALGAHVTVSARKSRDLGLISAMGYTPMEMPPKLGQFQVIFSTVPVRLLERKQLMQTDPQCLLIELAAGMEPIQERPYIRAAGLPGTYAPESAGVLIGKTILKLIERSSK